MCITCSVSTLLYYICRSSGYWNIARHRNSNINIREIIWMGNQLLMFSIQHFYVSSFHSCRQHTCVFVKVCIFCLEFIFRIFLVCEDSTNVGQLKCDCDKVAQSECLYYLTTWRKSPGCCHADAFSVTITLHPWTVWPPHVYRAAHVQHQIFLQCSLFNVPNIHVFISSSNIPSIWAFVS